MFAFGAAFAFALGSAFAAAAPLEEAPPLSAGAAALLDTVFGLTSSSCSNVFFGGGAAIISKFGLLASVLFASAVDVAFGVAFNIVIVIGFGSLIAFAFAGPPDFDVSLLLLASNHSFFFWFFWYLRSYCWYRSCGYS